MFGTPEQQPWICFVPWSDNPGYVSYPGTNSSGRVCSVKNEHPLAWFARPYDPFSLSQKISLTRSFHSLVRDIFFARENLSYGRATHTIKGLLHAMIIA